MNILLLIVGSWILFDGFVSATIFAWFVDHTFKNWQDQTVRAVRMIAGIIIILTALSI